MQTARQFGRRLHMRRQRRNAVRKHRIARIDLRTDPAHRRGRIDRRVEIVAERRAQRLFVALFDRDVVHDRRPQVLGLDRQHLGQGLGFGLQPLQPALGLGQRAARAIQMLAGGRMRGFGIDRGVFGRGGGALNVLDRQSERGEVGAVGGFQRVEFALDLGHFGFKPRRRVGRARARRFPTGCAAR